jgi:aminopeptidase YwaD
MSEPLAKVVERHLDALITGHPDRHVGRPGNVAATDYAESVLLRHRWHVESVAFEALDAETGEASLSIAGRELDAWPGPYSLPLEGSGPLLPIATLEALGEADLSGAVVLLHGGIAADQLLPKSFTFIEAPEHRRVYQLLESGQPLAVIGATGRGGGMSGGLYPYPLIEDGEFDVPNAYTTEEIGRQLGRLAGRTAQLRIEARRVTRQARQLSGRRGPAGAPRAIVMAHIDSKGGSPGAIDNATGVAALLTVAGLLEEYDGPYQVELLPVNGEDYYASSGEHIFVAANEGRWQEIAGAVNMDAIGARQAGTAVSMYAMTERGNSLVHRVIRRYPSLSFGEPWYESDHSIVAARGRPTMALTSTSFRELCATITHTERDTLDLVDPQEVSNVAEFVADLVRSLPAVGGTEA